MGASRATYLPAPRPSASRSWVAAASSSDAISVTAMASLPVERRSRTRRRASATRCGAVTDRPLMLNPLIATLPLCNRRALGSGRVSPPPALPNNTMRPPGATTSRSRSSMLVPSGSSTTSTRPPTAAAAPLMLATALLLLTDAARLGPGESVLVHSASGGVGSALAQLIHVLGGGLRIGTVGRADKVQSARNSGYEVALTRGDDLAAAVGAAAGGRVDVVLDPLGTSMLDLDLEVVAPGGRIVLFGNAGGGDTLPLPSARRLQSGNVAISGFSISGLSVTAPHRVAEALRRVLDLLSTGRLAIAVTEIASLAEAAATHDLLAEGRGAGKYVARLAPME